MTVPKTAYLSLGSNLGDPLNNLQDAVFAIQERAGDIQRLSPVYQSSSWGFDSHDFLNACVSLKTTLSPQKLLETVLQIETDQGRVRYDEEGYQDRKIDIDIL
ncbi:MAG: 2-amino-4-hydroxy-6-hydroxymethyldihydropteridine diphosphokinase, partial [Pricia sp.]